MPVLLETIAVFTDFFIGKFKLKTGIVQQPFIPLP